MTEAAGKEASAVRKKGRGAAVAITVGAAACAVCCVLPFAAPAALLAGLGGVLAWLGLARLELTIAAAVLVAIAWLWVAVRSTRTKKRPAASTLVALGAGTLILAAAVAYGNMG